MPSYHQPQDLAARGRDWIAAWNSHDLERVLALYAEHAEMTSDRIPAFGFDTSGTLRGKDNLRAYWGKALGLLPDLHFTVIDLFVSPDSVVVVYEKPARRADLRVSAVRCGRPDYPGLGQSSGAWRGGAARRTGLTP
jgi:ketosteroid isomerase-like protein